MRMFCLLLACAFSLSWCIGCGGGRPDPRANPDFDQAGYDDPSLGVQSLVEEAGN